uniref:Uncharacterized protein n=1 Tax=Arundo donax TaxID=35708 RepID=A0A0A9C9T4_ARUDO
MGTVASRPSRRTTTSRPTTDRCYSIGVVTGWW